PRFKVASSVEEAKAAAREVGFPVAMKVVSKDIVHKTDAGCVFLNVDGEELVEAYFKLIMDNALNYSPKAKVAGVLVEEMLPKGVEIVVGAFRDIEFGPTVMFGLGGVLVEVLKDVSFRVAPIAEDEAKEMMREVRGYRILEGYRGMDPVNLEAVVDVLVKTSRLIVENEEVEQVDLNPVIASRGQVRVADARVILRR
ncbi:MAG: acetate--CoA ligase family protein, partial [Desulfurococcaceae archaeon]